MPVQTSKPDVARPGRPLGGGSLAVLAELTGAPKSAREVASTVRQPVRLVVRKLCSLTTAGHVTVADLASRPPARRPVALYVSTGAAQKPATVPALCRSWLGRAPAADIQIDPEAAT